MHTRWRAALLLALGALAARSAGAAVESVRPAWEEALPREIYNRLTLREEEAAFLLRSRDGRIAVYEGGERRKPTLLTDIEISQLRQADRALLEKGIPAEDREQMLMLLEDLGS